MEKTGLFRLSPAVMFIVLGLLAGGAFLLLAEGPTAFNSRLVAASGPVGASDNVHLRVCNLSNADIDPPSATFHFIVLRP